MNRKLTLLVVAVVLIITMACSFLPRNIPFLLNETEPEQAVVVPISTEVSTTQLEVFEQNSVQVLDLAGREAILTALFERVNPGVVSIQTLTAEGGGLGSGFVYDLEGHIVTNYHVVEDATDLEVDFPSGYKVRGKVIATDLDSDLAVIKVDALQSELFPIPLADSDLLKVGQTVIAIGNPFGLSSTMTIGIVSAKGRTLSSFRESGTGSYFSAGDIIQTDAAINPGNSGGPLLNLNGEVVGINRAIRTDSSNTNGEPVNSGIGFSISSNIVSRVVPYLINDGFYDYPYVGITSQEDLTLIEREALDIEQSTGAYILSVSPNSPAERAGLIGGSRDTNIPLLFSGGDLIVAVDGRPVRVFGDFLSYIMANRSPGEEIVLTIIRNGVEKEVSLILDKRP
jgi:2-alkenal reductase